MKKKLLLILTLAISFVLLCGFTTYSNVVDLETTPTTTESTTEQENPDTNISEAPDTPETSENVGEETDTTTESTNSDNPSSDIEDGVMGGDYKFGDDLVSSDEDIGGFFQRLYTKLLEGLNGFQVIVIIILSILWVCCLIMLAVSVFSNPKKVLWYLLSLLILAVIIVCVYYAVPILDAFRSWFMK